MCLDTPCEIAQGMSKNICNYCNAGKERGGNTGKPELPPNMSHIISGTNVCRVKNAMKLGICSGKAPREKWREICREKLWVLSSFVC